MSDTDSVIDVDPSVLPVVTGHASDAVGLLAEGVTTLGGFTVGPAVAGPLTPPALIAAMRGWRDRAADLGTLITDRVRGGADGLRDGIGLLVGADADAAASLHGIGGGRRHG